MMFGIAIAIATVFAQAGQGDFANVAREVLAKSEVGSALR
jgi:hypothetical protein